LFASRLAVGQHIPSFCAMAGITRRSGTIMVLETRPKATNARNESRHPRALRWNQFFEIVEANLGGLLRSISKIRYCSALPLNNFFNLPKVQHDGCVARRLPSNRFPSRFRPVSYPDIIPVSYPDIIPVSTYATNLPLTQRYMTNGCRISSTCANYSLVSDVLR
jgi:hypothetical protein